jgi:xylan 1,4-beta-xylosidase
MPRDPVIVPDFTCSFSQPAKAFPQFWEHTVGSGHAPLALRADWQTQMPLCHDELGFQHVRFHARKTSGSRWAKSGL